MFPLNQQYIYFQDNKKYWGQHGLLYLKANLLLPTKRLLWNWARSYLQSAAPSFTCLLIASDMPW